MFRVAYTLILVLIFLGSCNNGDDESKLSLSNSETASQNYKSTGEKVNYGNNITLLWDLSNRVDRKSSELDTTVIFYVFETLNELFQNSVERNIYTDNFKIHSINELVLNNYINEGHPVQLHVGLERFNREPKKISDYLHRNGDPNLKSDLQKLKTFTKGLFEYSKSNQLGADLWHFFNENLNQSIVDLRTDTFEYGNQKFQSKVKNKIILLTDGYIEAGRYREDPTMRDPSNPNLRRYLSPNFIEEFREEFISSKMSSVDDFFSVSNYGIVPISDSLFKEVKILVIGFDDRTIKNGQSTVTPTDAKIIEIFWKDWFINSGLKESDFTFINGYQNKMTIKQQVVDFLKK